jgi:pimeloyl-ACP methyl ester carboxylesterase
MDAIALSADGTRISFTRAGSGPPLVVVDPALGYSRFDNIGGLASLLAEDFAVIRYDRRGRGSSGDAGEYAVEREVEDLAAVIAEAGGPARVYGYSSGGLVALHAAAAGVEIERMALFEPPVRGEGEPPELAFAEEIAGLVAGGRRGAAVERFLIGIGVPPEVVGQMPVEQALAPIAHTLVYDCEISNATDFDLLRSVTTPTLVIDSQASSEDLTGGVAAIAEALPNGIRRSLAGEWHGVPDEDLAPVVAAFLAG